MPKPGADKKKVVATQQPEHDGETPEKVAVQADPAPEPQPADAASIEHLIPDTFVAEQDVTGECPAKTNPAKFRACTVDNSADQMVQHESLGAYFVKKGDKDDEGNPIILNEDLFHTTPEGFLRWGTTVVCVRKTSVYERLNAKNQAEAERMRDGLKESGDERAADAAASRPGAVVEEAEIKVTQGAVPAQTGK